MTVIIPVSDPLRAKLFLDSVTDKTRLKIIGELLQNPLTLTELAEKLGLKPPTVSSHLEVLEGAGLVRPKIVREGGRPKKVYELVNKMVTATFDLEILAKMPSRSKLESLMLSYLDAKRRRKGFPATPSIDDIAKTLNISVKEAIVVKRYIEAHSLDITKLLASELLELLNSARKPLEIGEVAEKLNVDEVWAARAASYLEVSGQAVVREGKVYPKF